MTLPPSTYRGSFQRSEQLVSGDRRPEGCLLQSEGALMLSGIDAPSRELAEIFGVSRRLVSSWKTGDRTPTSDCRATAEARLGIPRDAWSEWRATGGSEEPAPASSPRAVVAPPPPAPDAFPAPLDGSVVDRARAMLAYLAVPGRTSGELAQAKEIRAALTLEARLVGAMSTKAKLHEHAEFGPFLDALVTRLAQVPGALDALDQVVGDLGADGEERAAA